MPNFGWALTPGSAMIPTDGSTMTVIVDGVALGTVDYNHCRAGASPTPPAGTCRDDIATLFPNVHEHHSGSGAIGVFSVDTTTLANGLHTIVWAVTDDQGRADGIGSRFFNVLNGGSSLTAADRRCGRRPRRRRRAVAAVGGAFGGARAGSRTCVAIGQRCRHRRPRGLRLRCAAGNDSRRLRRRAARAPAGVGPGRTATGSRYDGRIPERERHAAAAAGGQPARCGDRRVHVGAGPGLHRHLRPRVSPGRRRSCRWR